MNLILFFVGLVKKVWATGSTSEVVREITTFDLKNMGFFHFFSTKVAKKIIIMCLYMGLIICLNNSQIPISKNILTF